MKYYIIAGEASGDLHGSNLIREIKKLDPDALIRCWGGDKMQAEGGELVKHYRELAFMGFAEVVMNLRTIFRNLAFCKEDILEFKPDALVLIDYPGFNLRIAKWAKQEKIFEASKGKIIYYISPQVWAWKENRVKMMKACIDKMIVILPFEKDYFKKKWNWDVDYVGHPLVEVIEEWKMAQRQMEESEKKQLTIDNRQLAADNTRVITGRDKINVERPVIALLPGSRKQEISKKLPVMLEVSRSFPAYDFIVARAPGVEESFYNELVKDHGNVSWVTNKTYELLNKAKAALVTSGTATLETALFEVPEVVCYKGSWISYQVGKRVVKVKFIALVNLIMDKLVVKELIQDDLTTENLKKELDLLLNDPKRIDQLKKDYSALKKILDTGGNASAKAAKILVDLISTK